MEQDTKVPGKVSYAELSRLSKPVVKHNARLFSYKQQNKLVKVAAHVALSHVEFAKRNMAANRRR